MSKTMSERIDEGADTFAHDLLQSVAIIQSILGAIRAREGVGEQLGGELGIIETEVGEMGRLCQAVMDGPAVSVLVDLGSVARRAVDRIGGVYQGEIDIEVDDEEAILVGDPVAWNRALLNLIENACRAAGDQGKVVVCVHRTGESARIQVGDTGPGFGAGPSGRSSMGLVQITRLADTHDGHLELRSSPLGGAQLTIVVPVHGNASQDAPAG